MQPWEEPQVWAVFGRDALPRQTDLPHAPSAATTAIVRRPVVERRLGADRVLIDVVGKAVYVLNPTACGIWELSDGSHSAEEVVAEVARRYGIADGTAALACRQALAILEAADLVVGVDR